MKDLCRLIKVTHIVPDSLCTISEGISCESSVRVKHDSILLIF